MMPSQRHISPPELRSVRQSFMSLVDAMRFLQHNQELEAKIAEAKDLAEKRLLSLETLKVDIFESFSSLKEIVGSARTQELSAQIMGFATTAIDQMKQKVGEESQKQLELLTSDYKSERTKTIKSLEALLATSPLPLIDKSVIIELQDSAYRAKARYRCQEDIQYEFSLDTKTSPFFRIPFKLGQFDKSLKIPVGLGKSWLKKEPVPDFQRIEQYVVVRAEVTETSLIAECSDPEKDAHLKVVYSRQGNHATLSLSYSQANIAVDVTGEPGLNIHLDSEAFMRTTERLWLGINDLERKKIAITQIVCDNKPILESLDCADFFAKSWSVIAPRVKQLTKKGSNGSSSFDVDLEVFDEKMVREKIKLLGQDATELAQLLNVDLKDSS